MHEDQKRSAFKAVTWRIIATSTGMVLVFLFTGRLDLMAEFGIGDVVLKLLFYFLHERLWNMLSFGRSIDGKVTPVTQSN